MGHLIRFAGPRQIQLIEYDDPPVGAGEVRLKTLYSGISAGTELTAYRGSNPYLKKRWDPSRKLFVPGESALAYPVDAWGYEEVGCVIEVGPDVAGVSEGDLVWGTWGHRSTTTVEGQWAAERRLPQKLDPIIGIFSRLGAIALNAVLDADIHLGETVAVFGQGVPGLLVTQLALLSGATVVAVEGHPQRLDMAQRLGAAHVVDYTSTDVGEKIRSLTDGRGADVSIEISGSYPALHDAIRATAYNSRVVSAGFFQGEGVGLFLGEEFHHNRVELTCSQISGISRRLDHRWNLARLEQTVIDLFAAGRLDGKSLISHEFSSTDASEAFRLLDEEPAKALQVVLDFSGA